MQIDPPAAAKRLVADSDRDGDGLLTEAETEKALLPDQFKSIDANRNGKLSEHELTRCIDRTADELPNFAIPEMNGVGAMEFCVSTAEGVCDFISAMDTARVQEWNCWYHVLNCGFPLKVSGETDFPCMSSRSVGQGRVYVQLGHPQRIDFAEWCAGLGAGRSYVSDGYAHALHFDVAGQQPGSGDVSLAQPARVVARARVAFAPRAPKSIAYGNQIAAAGRRIVGDTVELHGPRGDDLEEGGVRLVELVVNGNVRRGAARTGRRRISPYAIQCGDRTQQLDGAAAVSPTAHEPGQCDRRRPPDPRLAKERPGGASPASSCCGATARRTSSPPSATPPAKPSTGPSTATARSPPNALPTVDAQETESSVAD